MMRTSRRRFLGGLTALAAGPALARLPANPEVIVVGAEARRAMVRGHVTRWAGDPWALGAYAAARPGFNHMRRRLAEPVADRLFFAGEACVPEWATQVAGAHLSGLDAAEELLAVVR